MNLELLLKFEFEASHSLDGYEAPHPHLWRLEFGVAGEPKGGRIIDLVILRSKVLNLIDQVSKTYLNDNTFVNSEVRKFPTCETLCVFFRDELRNLIEVEFMGANPSVRLSFALVAILSMDGNELGAARIS